jgi:hypothetical protein
MNNYKDQLHFYLALKISQNDLVPRHFQEMKVEKSTNITSNDLYSSLEFLTDGLNKLGYLFTPWFMENIEN